MAGGSRSHQDRRGFHWTGGHPQRFKRPGVRRALRWRGAGQQQPLADWAVAPLSQRSRNTTRRAWCSGCSIIKL